MNKRKKNNDIVRINLMGKQPPTKNKSLESTVVEPLLPPNSTPPTGVTLDQLGHTYRTIIKSQAIYYPVAYQLVRKLGQGRQGTVFLALRQGARGCITRHAIKLFDPSIYKSPQEYWTDMGRIASQISQLHAIQSPHLVSRHSYEENYGIGYVEMDAIDGVDLRYFLAGEHLEIAKARSTAKEWAKFNELLFSFESGKMALRPGLAVYILRRLLRGLERLHATNFLHCDMKPANIMIDRLGSVRIVDFGRAVIAGERLAFLLGAPMYMAPETHVLKTLDTRSDLYSVGLIGIELLRGEPITDANIVDNDELIAAKMSLVKDLNSLLPRSVRRHRNLIRTLRRLIEPEPDDRYPNTAEAEVGAESLKVVDKQFAQKLAVEYERELSHYLGKLVDERTERIEIGDSADG